MDVAGLALGVLPLALTLTRALYDFYDAYQREAERFDQLLQLDVEKRAFSRWVESRRFASSRAYEVHLQLSKSAKDDYHLACHIIIRIIVLLGEIAALLETETRSNRPFIQTNLKLTLSASKNTSTTTMRTDLVTSSAMSFERPQSRNSAVSHGATIAECPGTGTRITDRVYDFLKATEVEIKNLPPVSNAMRIETRSLDSLLIFATRLDGLNSRIKVSRRRRIKEACREIAFGVSFTTKLNELIGDLHKWNEYLSSLLSPLECKPPSLLVFYTHIDKRGGIISMETVST